MLVMDAMAQILRKEGIDTLFCFPTTPIIEAAVGAGLRPVICRQERVGVDMASGFARVANGKPPAVFAMQYGPGAENAFPGIASAYSDSVPILLLPLGHARDASQVYPMFKSTRTYESVTKQVEEITLPGEVGSVMRRAFNALKNGRQGPVMVETPVDVVKQQLAAEPDYRVVKRVRSAGDPRDIEAAADLLVAARTPMLLAGQGVLYAQASRELRELADLLQAAVMTTNDGKSAFPEDHALALGTGGIVYTAHGKAILAEADVILGVGCSLTPHRITSPALPASARVIHATNDARDLNKNYTTEIGILGDARLVLQGLIDCVRDRLKGKDRDGAMAQKIARLRDPWLAEWQAKLTSAETPMTPYRVLNEFMRVVDPADAIVTHDSGSPRDQILPFYRATVPRSYLGWGKSHQLGTGLGLAIGAKVAAPDKFCVNFMGDAAFGMTGLDFETAVRSGIPSCTIVLNNSTMAIEIPHMRLSHEKHRARDLGGNYAALAKDLGGWSERVEDPADVGNAILRAKRATEEGRTCLLEFVTSAETAFSNRI
ncbi:MAG: thiamine pyrophosphate-requiring protein [Alphaproteobacteria bacterium]|nr:thiamine pyrophosphate-requiring protein [Alphaproteobacteria bacterium]MCB9928168.1 thiamine pyrophosphate-requiring protein [Alphaproteobacteria bacterium]